MGIARLPRAYHPLKHTRVRHKVVHGGRGSAKSHTIATLLLLLGAETSLGILCAREVQSSIDQSVKKLLEMKIDALNLNRRYRVKHSSIEGRTNKTRFVFVGLRTNPDNARSMESIDIAWVEEAVTVSATSLDMLTPTVRNPDSEIWFSLNRRHLTDPIDKRFITTSRPDALVLHTTWRDNPYFPDVLEQERLYDQTHLPDRHDYVWEGNPLTRSDAKPLSRYTVQALPESLIASLPPLHGADWGFSNDPTAVVQVYHIPPKTLYIRRELYARNVPVDHLPAFFAGTDTSPPSSGPRWDNSANHPGMPGLSTAVPIRADGARPELIDHFRRRGFNIQRAKKGRDSVIDGVDWLASRDIVIHPDCVNTITECDLFGFKIDPFTDEVTATLDQTNNHIIDAMRYATEPVRNPRAPEIALIPPTVMADINAHANHNHARGLLQ